MLASFRHEVRSAHRMYAHPFFADRYGAVLEGSCDFWTKLFRMIFLPKLQAQPICIDTLAKKLGVGGMIYK